MKIAKIMVAAAIAAIAVLSSCKKEEKLGPASLKIDQAELTFEAAETSLPLTITATRDWNAVVSDGAQSWLTITPAEGKASSKEQEVSVKVMANTEFDRTGTITINLLSGSLALDSKVITVTQKGPAGSNAHEGTKESPYTVTEALEIINSGKATTDEVFVAGIISQIDTKDAPGNSYGNATYWISDDGTTATQLEVYRGLGLGGDKITTADYIKTGDNVIVAGVLVLFGGNTPEVAQGSYIYSLNGTVKEKGGDAPNYENAPEKTVAEFISLADKSTYYKLSGAVSNFNSTYSSFDLTDASGSIYVYSVANKSDWTGKISNGGTVVLAGKYDYYSAKSQHEVVDAYIISFEEGVADSPKGSGTLADPFNAAGAAQKVKDNGDKETAEDFYVKGKISSIKNQFDDNYGTAVFNISDDGSATSTQFTAYSVLYLGNRNWEFGDAEVAVGDEIVLCGKLTVYNGTYETASKKAYVYSINGQTEIAKNKVLGVESTAIDVSATATSATIKVKGNVAWTATCDNAAFSLDKASGEGAGEIAVTFAVNEDTQNAKVANITITTEAAVVGEKSFTVVLTQAKATEAGSREIEFVAGTDKTGSTAAGAETLTKDGVTIDISNGAMYRSDNYRVYKNATIKFTAAAGNIVKVVFTCTASGTAQYGPGCFANATSGTYTATSGNIGTWEGSAPSFSLTAASNQVRATKIVVTVAE